MSINGCTWSATTFKGLWHSDRYRLVLTYHSPRGLISAWMEMPAMWFSAAVVSLPQAFTCRVLTDHLFSAQLSWALIRVTLTFLSAPSSLTIPLWPFSSTRCCCPQSSHSLDYFLISQINSRDCCGGNSRNTPTVPLLPTKMPPEIILSRFGWFLDFCWRIPTSDAGITWGQSAVKGETFTASSQTSQQCIVDLCVLYRWW